MAEQTTNSKLQTKRAITNAAVFFVAAYFLYYYPHLFAEYQKNTINPPVARQVSEPAGQNWRYFKSAYFTIEFTTDVDLETVESKLQKRGIFFIPEPNPGMGPLDTIECKIAYKLDMLFKKAKEILDMKPRVRNLKIKIFKNQKELDDEYYKIFGKGGSETAFFVYRYSTIYTSENNISDSVMAHEMAHAVVDHYFVVRPPENVRELLAQYVDLHLED